MKEDSGHATPGQPADPPGRHVRSFVRRTGRITTAQTRALATQWRHFGAEINQATDARALFPRDAPVTLEIGFGAGDTLLRAATETPEENFLGVEVYDAGIGQLLLGAAAVDLTNLRVIRGDAVELLHALAPESLARIWIFFPDPWPKKRHHKRRLIQPSLARLIASRLEEGGTLELATDWEEYAWHMLNVLDATPHLANRAGEGTFARRPSHRGATRFEQRGRQLGHAVFDLNYAKV